MNKIVYVYKYNSAGKQVGYAVLTPSGKPIPGNAAGAAAPHDHAGQAA